MKKNLLFLFFGALLFAYGCYPYIRVSTMHPDSDKEITFTVTRGTVRGTISEMRLEIGGTVVATEPGNSLTFTGGPYPVYSNRRLNYRGIAVKSGSSPSTSGWRYVANPKNVHTYSVPNGSNNGYPDATSEQTGANLYRLDKDIVLTTAQNAALEYANFRGITFEEVVNNADNMVAAVAYFVDEHMGYRKDSLNQIVFADNGWGSYSPGWDFPQPADLTLTISGDLTNASPTDDYMGDCEDYAILRAALLRALGFAPWAIWDAIDYHPGEDREITHEYNIVLYEGAYRIMDYGLIERWLDSHTSYSHVSYFGWNEEHGPRGPYGINHTYLKENTDNFPGGKDCSADWSYLIYYKNTCE